MKTATRPSQTALILKRLRKSRGWVPMPELVAASGSYAIPTRVSEINRRGDVRIENRTERRADGGTDSFYRLIR